MTDGAEQIGFFSDHEGIEEDEFEDFMAIAKDDQVLR